MDYKEKQGMKYIGWWIPITELERAGPSHTKFIIREKERLERQGFHCSIARKKWKTGTAILLARKVEREEIITGEKDHYYSRWINYLGSCTRRTLKELIENEIQYIEKKNQSRSERQFKVVSEEKCRKMREADKRGQPQVVISRLFKVHPATVGRHISRQCGHEQED